MNTDWQAFLDSKGAHWVEGRVTDFGAAASELDAAVHADVICDLSHTGLIAVSGEDAQSFLQGQFSNDIRLVSSGQSQLSAYCSPKGRMLASFRVFQRDDVYYLRLPIALLESTLKRLRMFVLRAKLKLEDASDQLMRIGISGEHVADRLAATLGAVPETIDAAVTGQGLTVLRIPGSVSRYEIFTDVEAMRSLWEALCPPARPAGAPAWGLLDIQAGIPSVHPQTVDAFVPQMVNLQLINGVNFKKGCYPGQEVVARMQYLGKLKRRMYRARVDTDSLPLPGDELFAPGTESGQGTGRIVDAQPHPAGGCELLAVIQISDVEAGEIRLNDASGPLLQFAELPYTLEASA